MIKYLNTLSIIIKATTPKNNSNILFGYCVSCDCIRLSEKLKSNVYKCICCNSLDEKNIITLDNFCEINNKKIKYIFKHNLVSKKKLRAYKKDLHELYYHINQYKHRHK